MEEECIVGLKMRQTFMRENFKMGGDMVGELFGGKMEADMKEIFIKEGRQGLGPSIEKEK